MDHTSDILRKLGVPVEVFSLAQTTPVGGIFTAKIKTQGYVLIAYQSLDLEGYPHTLQLAIEQARSLAAETRKPCRLISVPAIPENSNPVGTIGRLVLKIGPILEEAKYRKDIESKFYLLGFGGGLMFLAGVAFRLGFFPHWRIAPADNWNALTRIA